MEAVVVNLAAQPARWATARQRFEAVGLPMRFNAVTGRSMRGKEREPLYSPTLNSRQYYRSLQPGEIGCYASHLHIWQSLVRSNQQALAVFEDDVQPDRALPDVLSAIERMPVPWDMVKLIGWRRENVRSRLALLPQCQLIQYQRVPSFTSAYVITRQAAQKLLARRLPFGRPVDDDLRYWWECGLHVLGVQPYPTALSSQKADSMMEDRRVAKSAALRIHKLMLQAHYSMMNAWHVAGETPWQLNPQSGFGDNTGGATHEPA